MGCRVFILFVMLFLLFSNQVAFAVVSNSSILENEFKNEYNFMKNFSFTADTKIGYDSSYDVFSRYYGVATNYIINKSADWTYLLSAGASEEIMTESSFSTVDSRNFDGGVEIKYDDLSFGFFYEYLLSRKKQNENFSGYGSTYYIVPEIFKKIDYGVITYKGTVSISTYEVEQKRGVDKKLAISFFPDSDRWYLNPEFSFESGMVDEIYEDVDDSSEYCVDLSNQFDFNDDLDFVVRASYLVRKNDNNEYSYHEYITSLDSVYSIPKISGLSATLSIEFDLTRYQNADSLKNVTVFSGFSYSLF